MGLSIDELALLVEVVVDVGIDRGELLQCLHPLKPQHRSLSSSDRQVGIFRPVVEPAAHLTVIEITKLTHGGRV